VPEFGTRPGELPARATLPNTSQLTLAPTPTPPELVACEVTDYPSTAVIRPGLTCSFCARMAVGGVAGPETSIYICPDCIRLANELLQKPEDEEPTSQ
jgi:hypothetical protein